MEAAKPEQRVEQAEQAEQAEKSSTRSFLPGTRASHILHAVFTASEQDMAARVIDPAGWVKERASTPLVLWDAGPV